MKIIERGAKVQGAKDGIMPLLCVSIGVAWEKSVDVYSAAACVE
jgi:hypothetical protein